jgi:hypothetical protein
MGTKFRTSFTHVAGHDPANIVQGRIINVNVVKWTVDVAAQFDRKKYFNIQVASPYLHHSNGEGIYAFPEIGATVMVCLPSDSSAPFVQCFVMASEVIDDASPDAPLGTNSHSQPADNATDATFAGGRPRAIPGSIYMRTRDGNRIALHRGGVLEIGSTELCQSVYIPLNNLLVDTTENYEHHNAAGSVRWGLQDGPSLEKFPGQFMQTFRIYATDQYADVKFACGKVFAPVPEPDAGVTLALAEVGAGDDNPIILELAVSPQGFIAESGDIVDLSTVAASVMKFTFDRKGNTLLRVEGNVVFQMNKRLTFKVKEELSIETEAHGQLKAANGFDIDGGTYTHIKGEVVRLGRGTIPVAHVGSIVSTLLAAMPLVLQTAAPIIPGMAPNPIFLTTPVAGLVGSIVSGNQGVLA